MKKRVLVALLACCALVAVAAQENAAPKKSGPVTEMQIFSVETSLMVGYSLSANDLVTGYSLLVNFAVADNFAVGFQGINGVSAATIAAMKLNFYLSDLIGFSATLGGDGTSPWIGVGGFVTLLPSKSNDSFSNAMRVRLEYLLPTSDWTTGAIMMSLGFSLGI